MARALEESKEVRLASKELIGVYRSAAETFERSGEAGPAAVEFERCLTAARDAGDRPAEARAALSLGRALVLRGGQPTEAVRILQGAELLCRELGDSEGEGRACAALAAAWRARGDDEKAREYLEDCLEHAVVTEDLAAQASACRTLGALHAARRDFSLAVDFLERNFNIARQLLAAGNADANLVDRARVDLGIAVGNATLGRYLRALNADFGSLLLWKNSREPLPASDDEDDDDDDEEEADGGSPNKMDRFS
jgi:tetratricopeptide (TPR) repeat protein